MLTKCFSKEAAASQCAAIADRGDGLVSFRQQMAGFLEPVAFQISQRSGMQAVMENTKTLPLTYKSSRSDIANGYLCFKIFMNIN